MSRWQLQQAKQQFSRVVDRAQSEGAQIVTRHGKEVAVVLGIDEYRRLRGTQKDFKAFLIGPPHIDVDLPIGRSKEPPRKIDFP